MSSTVGSLCDQQRSLFDTPKRRLTIQSGVDQFGRCNFTLEWWEQSRVFDEHGQAFTADHPDLTGGWRGQCFFADPTPYLNDDTEVAA